MNYGQAAAAPGRITLAVICVLITINSYYSVMSTLPNVSYPVWLLTFLFGSALFNVAAFVEYACHSITHRPGPGGADVLRAMCAGTLLSILA